MTKYTDQNIPIECYECPTTDWEKEIGCAYGIQNMIQHIKDNHPNYSALEADAYATRWLEHAYDVQDEQDRA